MTPHSPLVVAILHANTDDIDYQLYCAAYGLEMQIDDDWNAELVLLAPYDHLYAVTENTGVTGEDTAIVSAGVTDIPLSDTGFPNISQVNHSKNNWVLVGDPRRDDHDDVVAQKLKAAIDADCRVIIGLANVTIEHIVARTKWLSAVDGSRVVIALLHPDATSPEMAASAAKSVRDQINEVGLMEVPRFIVAGHISGDNVKNVIEIDGVDGVILMDDKYPHFGTILEVLEAVGG